MYYEIDINIQESTYNIKTYSVDEATSPIKYEYGKRVLMSGKMAMK